MAFARDLAATIAVAGALTAGSALTAAATAAADPPPPPPPADPAAPVEIPPITGPMGAQLTNPGQGINLAELLLPQHQVPAVQGTAPVATPDYSALNTQWLLPPNMKLGEQAAGDTFYGSAPNDPNAPAPDKWEYFKRSRGAFHSVMGKLDQDQLGQPLPGTAPLPGSNIPAGTGENLPELPPPPGLPPAPGAPVPPAPAP
jgi:hypothetical protein